ncbi:MAG: hypothetical protein COU33_04210 [Candidatus Magasanikbacteria bacterium CG10_big_fil_rev_8_21_14_0_10_43_6]|uniref:Thymidine kinase n=1 Tax=Candidatus Magasanikbacteria bacterium CG10_big_fil_rev_8_21_14_0_10_43_6 TaxID=1974650 RepID=A0A2M6W0B2_9BACT|nr:MAG: hypothetical protein COU33_04210 [Candidatus Magasanikbacteria bacterium CG10_big_fil_rev_8_21_14_0_10_43_6]
MQSEAFWSGVFANSQGLVVITGPMFAGKSKTLLRALSSATATGCSTQVMKSSIDGKTHVSSREGGGRVRVACTLIDKGQPLPSLHADVVLVDEVQFLEQPHVDALIAAASERLIILAGLHEDSRGESFGELRRVLEQHQPMHVLRLTARCDACGAEALHSQRLVSESTQVLVDQPGMKRFGAACPDCWVPR